VVKRYVAKISGPLLDRIDLHVEVTPVSYDELTTTQRPKLTSAEIRQRVHQLKTKESLQTSTRDIKETPRKSDFFGKTE